MRIEIEWKSKYIILILPMTLFCVRSRDTTGKELIAGVVVVVLLVVAVLPVVMETTVLGRTEPFLVHPRS